MKIVIKKDMAPEYIAKILIKKLKLKDCMVFQWQNQRGDTWI